MNDALSNTQYSNMVTDWKDSKMAYNMEELIYTGSFLRVVW